MEAITGHLLSLSERSRGRVVVRELVHLRYSRSSAENFPLSREAPIFLYRGQAVGFGYYWEGNDPLKALMPREEEQVLGLAQEAAVRMDVPYLAVYVGQIEGGNWIVIETGDGQFSGVSQTPFLSLWNGLRTTAEGSISA